MADATPYFSDEQTTLWCGDSLAVLRELPDASVDCCVTSPPYFGLRDYGEAGQYGLESSPAEYVETMRAVFAEVRRVLADDGTLWLNIGDSYSGGLRGAYDPSHLAKGVPTQRPVTNVPAKNLLGIPWRTAFALQDDGCARLAEHEDVPPDVGRRRGSLAPTGTRHDKSNHPNGRNPGDVWTVATQPFSAAHFAVMPQALAERAVLAGCRPGGTVLDPFSGSGTTGLAASKHGRRYVGIDLSADYLDLSLRTRLAQPGLTFGEASA